LAGTNLDEWPHVWSKSRDTLTLLTEVGHMVGLTGDHVEHLPFWASDDEPPVREVPLGERRLFGDSEDRA
jgi:hypothetical protein